MDRISAFGFVVDVNGRRIFVDQDLVGGVAGTDCDHVWLTGVQEEIVSLAESEGIAPNANDNTLLQQAVRQIVQTAIAIEAATRLANDTAEATARSAADTAEYTARVAADEAEAAMRVAADTTEATERGAADTAEYTARVAADQAEAAMRVAADTTEANERGAADAAETAARIASDQSEAEMRVAADTTEAMERGREISAETDARTAADIAQQADYTARDAVVLSAAEVYANGSYDGNEKICPGGFIIKFGSARTVNGSEDGIVFPTPFPNACLAVICSEAAAQPNWQTNSTPTVYGVTNADKNGFGVTAMKFQGGAWVYNAPSGFFYIAVGG